jgi:putative ABC transport system permease protein
MMPVALGAAIGLVGAAGAARWIATLLYGIHALDPTTFVVVPVTLAIASLAAIYGPVRRATASDPGAALRAD